MKIDAQARAALEELAEQWRSRPVGSWRRELTGELAADELSALLLRMESEPEGDTECVNCERPVCRRKGCAVYSEVCQALCSGCYKYSQECVARANKVIRGFAEQYRLDPVAPDPTIDTREVQGE